MEYEILSIDAGHFEKHALVVAILILVNHTCRRFDLNLVAIANNEERAKLGVRNRRFLNLLSRSLEIIKPMRILVPSEEVEFEAKKILIRNKFGIAYGNTRLM